MLGIMRLALSFLFLAVSAFPQTRLLRQPHYHAGSIVFSFQGDIWTAREDGTQALRLTTHPARDIAPRFSPDGKSIAFTSNRYGNYDVFVMPSTGGEAKQLTWHSGADMVAGWSRDGSKVLFTSARGDGAFPSVSNLYEVPVAAAWSRWWEPIGAPGAPGRRMERSWRSCGTRKGGRGSTIAAPTPVISG